MSQRKRKAHAAGRNGRPAKADLPPGATSRLAAETSARRMSRAGDGRRWLLAATTALFVARPLFPSESVVQSGEGIAVVMFSLLLLVAWGIMLVRHQPWTLRFGATDLAVFVLLAIHSLAALYAAQTGNARAALNVLWAWVGLGVGFFLLRQLVQSAREARAVVAVMIALGAALSVYGLYQYAVDLPQLRRDYARDPEGKLQAEGLWWEPGSVARVQFEERLKRREPFAPCALPHSLAGYLAPWLVMAIGLAALGRWRNTTGILLITAVGAACLLLTKSRSALVATAVGLGLVALARLGQHRSIGWRWPAVGAAILLTAVVGAVATGGLDAEVLTEAGKSLGYRLQYWQSTLAMIQDRPWLGCGPGQFQSAYPAYKLPQASEDIADPHNFLLEVWATAGTPAAVALLAVLGCFAWATVSLRTRRPASAPPTEPPGEETPDAARWVYGGGLVGFSLAWPLGIMGTTAPHLALLVMGLPLAAATVFFLADWVRRGDLPIALVIIGLGVLLINLLAAGGIGFPGVSGTLWLLVAIGLVATEGKPQKTLRRPIVWLVPVLAAALAGACYWTAYKPVLSAQGSMAAATFDVENRRAHLLVAAAADPLWPECSKQLAQLALANWRDDHDPKSLAQFQQYTASALALDPQSSPSWAASGDQYLDVYGRTSSPEHLSSAVAAYRRATALAPNKAEYHGKLAIALDRAGQRRQAQEEAQTAIRLDDAMPHRDKKLPPKLRQPLLRISLGP